MTKRKLLVLLLSCLCLMSAFTGALFYKRLQTLQSSRLISSAPAFEITYTGHYGLDFYLRTGISSHEEQFNFLLSQFTFGIGPIIYNFAKGGCSGFFATSPEGDYLFARNFDTPGGIGTVVLTDGSEGYPAIMMSEANWLGIDRNTSLTFIERILLLGSPYMIADGMNTEGLAVAFFTAAGAVPSYDPNKITLHDHTLLSAILARCATVEEALTFLETYNVLMIEPYTSHYMFCDATGASVIVEYIEGDLKVIPSTESYQAISNFLLYDNPNLLGQGRTRYKNYLQALRSTDGILTTTEALELLKENVIPDNATWSVVYNLTKRTATLTFFGDYETIFVYDFEN